MFEEFVLVGVFVHLDVSQDVVTGHFQSLDGLEFSQHKKYAFSHFIVFSEVSPDIFGEFHQLLLPLADIFLTYDDDDSEFFHLLDGLVGVKGVHDVNLA